MEATRHLVSEGGKARRCLHFFFIPVVLLVMVACGIADDRFRLEGHFKNLNQGEFYLYHIEEGMKDTIGVRDGQFVYEINLRDTSTLILMFPNFSELPIFALPGTKVKIDGDVSHLKETEITGSKENEQMTDFRLACNELMPPEVKERAEQFILENPKSVVSNYLLRKYFILGLNPDYKHAFELCDTLLKTQPSSLPLVQLHQQLKVLRNMKTTGKLPKFSAKDTNGKTVDNKLLKDKVGVIVAWATWSFNSQNSLRQLKKLYKEHSKELCVVTVCLDASPQEGRFFLQNDSLTWPNICDGKLWHSPVVEALSFAFVPDNIVVDKKGNIVARSLKTTELSKEVESQLRLAD